MTLALLVAGAGCGEVADGPPGTLPAGTLRIMPLGDSITQGNTTAPSYRRQLSHQLTAGGYAVDFVGSLDSGFGGNAATDFDRNHEGHWGWRADELLAQIDGWALAAQPDIVLLHAGTNDAAQGQSASSTVAEIGQVIDAVRVRRPEVVVLLAQIIPANLGAATTANINSINASLPGLAASKTTTQSPVTIVDQATGFNAVTDTYDGVHPNTTGESKMAARWYAALTALIPPPPTTTTTTTTVAPTTTTPGTTTTSSTTTLPPGSSGSVSFVGAAAGNGAVSDRAQVALPPLLAGDLIVVGVQVAESVAVQPPAGYAVVRDVTGGPSSGLRLVVMQRVADGSESVFTLLHPVWARSADLTVAAVYRGVDPVVPVEASAGMVSWWAYSVSGADLTSSRAGARVVSFARSAGASTAHTWAAPMVPRAAVCCTAASVADRAVGAGATGRSTLTFTAATRAAIVDLVLRPAATTPPPPPTTTTTTTLPPTTTTTTLPPTTTTLPPTTTTSTTLPPTTTTTTTLPPPTTTTTTLPPTTTTTTLPPTTTTSTTTTTTTTTLAPTTTTSSTTTTTTTTLAPTTTTSSTTTTSTTTTLPPGSSGSVSFVGAAVGNGAVSDRVQVALPPLLAGDLIVVGVQVAESVAVQPPPGYVVARDVSGGSSSGLRLVVMYRVANGSETVFTLLHPVWARSADLTVAAVYRGVDPVVPVEASAGMVSWWAYAVSSADLTSSRSGARVVSLARTAGASTAHAWAAPMVPRAAVCCTAASLADRAVGAGATGRSTVTFTAPTRAAIVDLVLRPR